MRRRARRGGTRAVLALAICAVFVPGAARAELALLAYGGASLTSAHRVVLTQGRDTRLTFDGVSWAGESRKRPIYYGFRATWWLPRSPAWGIALDYTHVKTIARLHHDVHVSGTRAGAAVDDVEPLVATFDELAFSHGLNLATVSAVRRLAGHGAGARAARSRLEPHASLGAGVTVPHVQVRTAAADAHGYQVGGPALVAGLGVEARVAGPVSALAEYRLSWADVGADLSPNGSVQTRPWTHHFGLGVSLALR